MTNKIRSLSNEIIKGHRLGYDEAMILLNETEVEDLCELADDLRRHFNGNKIDTCSILNAKSGRCGEDCKWCSQSVFHKTNIEVYPLVNEDEALREAGHNSSKGVRHFSLVTSGRTLNDNETGRICHIYDSINHKVDISLCASLGLLNKEQLQRLKESGVERYHCNIETAPSFFGEMCSTHTLQEKMQTIQWAKEVGMDVCSGGIIGMGESEEQRVEFAVALQKIGVVSIPMNVLNPIKGTKLENVPPLSDDEIFRAVAITRIINPEADIRLAGGRNMIKPIEERLLGCGVSAMIVGDMLTTLGSDIDTDKEMFRRCGFEM